MHGRYLKIWVHQSIAPIGMVGLGSHLMVWNSILFHETELVDTVILIYGFPDGRVKMIPGENR
jgi:hypothetical protein